MSNNITEVKASEVSPEEIDTLDQLIQTLGSGELHDTLMFMLEKLDANKNLYIIATF